MLAERRVLLIIGGGIAAYKCLDLIRRLRERGCQVRVITRRRCAFGQLYKFCVLDRGIPMDRRQHGYIWIFVYSCVATRNSFAQPIYRREVGLVIPVVIGELDGPK